MGAVRLDERAVQDPAPPLRRRAVLRQNAPDSRMSYRNAPQVPGEVELQLDELHELHNFTNHKATPSARRPQSSVRHQHSSASPRAAAPLAAPPSPRFLPLSIIGLHVILQATHAHGGH